ncbi:MAG: hypothetical protein IJP11_08065 [Oscillospiraceae bacterium]|nr:hypothetical protein [Oscillospiraceae bacterium]
MIRGSFFWEAAHPRSPANKADPNPILAVQARLYRAKSLVDSCVTAALLSVVLAPGSLLSVRLDFFGSIIVALYLIWCGIRTVYEAGKKQDI